MPVSVEPLPVAKPVRRSFRSTWTAWGWLVALLVSLASAAYGYHAIQACRAAASQSPAVSPECGPGLTLQPGESCSITIPMPSPTPSRAPHGLFAPRPRSVLLVPGAVPS